MASHGLEEDELDELEIVEEVTSFSFEIPQGVKEGVKLKVVAPDQVTLHIPVPNNVVAGDKMVMVKSLDGKWGIKHVVRGEGHAAPALPMPAQTKSADDVARDLSQPYVCTVELRTTKGMIILRVVPSWAPKGAQRFLQLITDKYYTDLPIYRAVPDFLIQFGVSGDADQNWKYEAIEDDESRGVPFLEGMVCLAASSQNSRMATLCIFLTDFPQLGKKSWETPFARVSEESLPVLRSIYTGYGDMPQCGGSGPDPIQLQDGFICVLTKYVLSPESHPG
eukprot:symbB.v1.2.040282.t1/scaffold7123.1/size13202/2